MDDLVTAFTSVSAPSHNFEERELEIQSTFKPSNELDPPTEHFHETEFFISIQCPHCLIHFPLSLQKSLTRTSPNSCPACHKILKPKRRLIDYA